VGDLITGRLANEPFQGGIIFLYVGTFDRFSKHLIHVCFRQDYLNYVQTHTREQNTALLRRMLLNPQWQRGVAAGEEHRRCVGTFS
jgi:hypothetical protein